ncbi:SDR family NAD(P)-dependent oxidoreductase [Microcella alkaliphila]|uniref:Short-chain dehydrogenase/reductase SDR n=1 Tax=Microcella alkaliphila TaxID=279828 RepID=A0A0U5BI20_9MICO|nr:SDR family oxidoreductase [Microcella alkaliphila]BAU31189.1 short-chain dehydrogenase/reductase SDR [Microcella alkaliphila]
MTDAPLRSLVTGSASGIGAAVVARLRARGDRVVGVDRTPVDADTLVVDLADPAARAGLVGRASEKLGGIDTVICVAGIFRPTPLDDADLDAWRSIWAVNLEAPMDLMAQALPVMRENGFGRIVTISSVHGRFAQRDCIAYDVGKAGLDAATRSVALDGARSGILANSVAPGFVRTPMSLTADGVDETDTTSFRERYGDGGLLPLGRAAHASEVAEVVAWLSGRENGYLTGQVVTVDGGLTSTF